MFLAFWLVMALLAVLMFTNTREVVTRYIVDHNKTKLLVYIFPLLAMGYLVVHMTFHIIDFAKASEEQDIADAMDQ